MTLDTPISSIGQDTGAKVAPFQSSAAGAPVGAHAEWVTTEDGVRLRLGVLGRGNRGTVLALQGRTEYLEKYGVVATEFAQRGFGLIAVDFRGQGHSDRFTDDPRLGHVAAFSDYQHDVAALVEFAKARRMPKPWYLLAHSMGGAIGLRAVTAGLQVKAAVFSAPMWGIEIPSALKPVAWSLGWAAHKLHIDNWGTPGMGLDAYPLSASAENNLLTHDPEMLAYIQRQLLLDPALQLGGPSVPWLYRAMVECRDLRANFQLDIPSLVVVPTQDKIVSKSAMRELANRCSNCQLLEIDGGRHETMMETSDRRNLFYDQCVALFERNT